jgi:glycosyltransferase involved in cell wall biosynthesis
MIFVQLASYRDPQLPTTIDQMLDHADNPDQFSFGVCWQHDDSEMDVIKKYKKNKKVRINKFHYSESKGLGWARAEANKLHAGEELLLQLDSHHRFVKGWDTMMLEDYNQCFEYSKKPVLTTYLTPFEAEKEHALEPVPCLMSQYEFSPDRLLMSRPWYIQDYKDRTCVIRSRTISGHFYLTSSKFLKEVPYDPDIYFGGYVEETTLSVRAHTWGYDFFSPYRQYMWHEYTRNNRPKHWDDHGKQSATNKTSGERDTLARNKTRQLFAQEHHGIKMGKYGLGPVRTLKDYEIFGGFDFKNCRIQDYTLKVETPPNPGNYEKQFLTKDSKVTCKWDLDFFKKCNFTSPEVLTLGLIGFGNKEVFRADFTQQNYPEYFNLHADEFVAEFNSMDEPKLMVMYYKDKEKGWSDRYEKAI